MPFDDTVFLEKNVNVLSFFSEETLRNVTIQIERKIYKKGQTLVFQGEVSDDFHVIKRGKAMAATRQGKDKVELAELGPGDFFGEMSILENVAAIVTIKAIEDDTEVLTFPHEALQYLLKNNPQMEAALKSHIEMRRNERTGPRSLRSAWRRPAESETGGSSNDSLRKMLE